MKAKEQNIWIGGKDLNNDPEFHKELQMEFPMDNSELAEKALERDGNRRDFLKLMGFSLGAATMAAGCDIPVKRAMPYVTKPEEIVPGVATYYASAITQGGDFCPVIVKTREGRPIKIEGNPNSSMTGGGTSARAQASVLSLYDVNRFKKPHLLLDGKMTAASWSDLDKVVKGAVAKGKVRVITNSVLSPSDKAAMQNFAQGAGGKVITYDPVSSSAMLEANEQSFGKRAVPAYRFDKADVIVSFNADFLGTWISPIEYTHQYAKGRNPEKRQMSRLVQVESHMSLTGSNADNRILVKPSEQGAAIAALANAIVGGVNGPKLNDRASKAITKVAGELRKAAGKSLVVSASNNVAEQILVNAINNTLGNYGNTLSFSGASMARQGNERDLEVLVSEIKSGLVDTVIFNNCNPLYDYAKSTELAEALQGVSTLVGMSYAPNETTAACNVIAPVNHILESWGDAEAKQGEISIIQPTIAPLFDTRQAGESLSAWSGGSPATVGAYESLQKAYEAMYTPASGYSSFESYWDAIMHGGGMSKEATSISSSFSADMGSLARLVSKPVASDLEISFFEPIGIGNGQYTDNPWLMEMPDPVTRTSWGNYLAVPVGFDGVRKMIGLNDLKDGDLIKLTVGSKEMIVPVIQQFGQMPGTVALALGYGRENSGPCASGVGVNVNDCLTTENGLTQLYNTNVSVSNKIGEEDHFSCVQYHHAYGLKGTEKDTGNRINADEAILGMAYGKAGYQGSLTERSVMYTTNLKDLDADIAKLKEKREFAQHLNDQTLYPYEEYKTDKYEQGHHWGMHVDLNACTGCGACTVACMAENNVPVVGKKEVSRHHEMTWLRIDRYFYGDIENPNTVYQPLMCQHCDNAPCENVCPVNATNHSAEGLNQMTYNRCIGTRYCANNCPFKVRRFNWYDYTTADLFPGNQVKLNDEDVPFGADNLTRMVLNPDVTVRSRGVIEKCSFCVQKIQEGKLTAKSEGRRLKSSDVRTACQSACPSGAITFGDQNDKGGELSKKLKSDLNFVSLEEINVRSSITYTMKVNNRDENMDA